MSSLEHRKEFINYFKNLTTFDRKQFDRYITQAEQYSNEFGLDENDLELIATVSFKQNLASQRIINVINTLIPKTNVPESVVKIVLKWMLYNYNQNFPQLAMKHVLLWIIGLIEYELTNSEVINNYYDCFFYLLKINNNEAARLIYLLTKPVDVNRWLVKQLLRFHKVNTNSKTIGVLLYLFKTYRPDCVPENVPAYAVQAVFKKIPNKLSSGFERAKERSFLSNTIPQDLNNIKWNKNSIKHKGIKAITLVPRLPPMKHMNVKTSDYKSLITVTNRKDLQKYMLEQNEITCTLSLLNNSAGYHVLKFSDIKVQSRFSFILYHILYDAFIQNNPYVSEDEKNYLLKCLAMLQINIQQNITVISKFVSEFMITWDGYDFVDNLTVLLQFLNFENYKDLNNCILKYLKIIFISGTLNTKCRILKILGDLTVNIIWDYIFYQKLKYQSVFLDAQPQWNFKNVITNLYSYIKEICKLGYYLENNHSLMDHCIANLNDKILSIEKYAQIHMWNIMPILSYSALFDYSPHLILRVCELLTRHKNSLDPVFVSDYMYLLFNKRNEYVIKNSFVNELSITRKRFLEKFNNFTSYLQIDQHMSFKCIKNKNIFNKTQDYDTIIQLKELFIFANIYFKDKDRQINTMHETNKKPEEDQDKSTNIEVVQEKRRSRGRPRKIKVVEDNIESVDNSKKMDAIEDKKIKAVEDKRIRTRGFEDKIKKNEVVEDKSNRMETRLSSSRSKKTKMVTDKTKKTEAVPRKKRRAK